MNIKIKPRQCNVNIEHFVFCKHRSFPVSNSLIIYLLLEMVPTSLHLKTVVYIRLNVLVIAEGGALAQEHLLQNLVCICFKNWATAGLHLRRGRYVHLCGEGRVLICTKKQHALARVFTNEFSTWSDIFLSKQLR